MGSMMLLDLSQNGNFLSYSWNRTKCGTAERSYLKRVSNCLADQALDLLGIFLLKIFDYFDIGRVTKQINCLHDT